MRWFTWPVNTYGSVPVRDPARHRRILLLCAVGHGVVLVGVVLLAVVTWNEVATARALARTRSPMSFPGPALVALTVAQVWFIISVRRTRAAVVDGHADIDTLARVLRQVTWPTVLVFWVVMWLTDPLLYLPGGSPVHPAASLVTSTPLLLVLAQLTTVYRCVTGSGVAPAPIPGEVLHRMRRKGSRVVVGYAWAGVLLTLPFLGAALPSATPGDPPHTVLRIGITALVVALAVPLVLSMARQRQGVVADPTDPARLRRAAELLIGYGKAAAVVVPVSVLGASIINPLGPAPDAVRHVFVGAQLFLAVITLTSASAFHIGYVPIRVGRRRSPPR